MGKKGKGTGSFGKRKNKSHTLCRRYAIDIVTFDRRIPRESLSGRIPNVLFFFPPDSKGPPGALGRGLFS